MGSPRKATSPCMIVGYNRTESARHAAMWAASELPPSGRLVIVHSCRPLHVPPSPLLSSRERRQLGRALIDELLLEAEPALFDVVLETEVSDDDPVSALTSSARRHNARAIVVGCEQHARLHMALGTVTSELLRASPVPVTVVPSTAKAFSLAVGSTPAASLRGGSDWRPSARGS